MRVAIGSVVLTSEDVDFVVEADRLGTHSVWVPEAWGQDALTPLAFLAARTSSIRLGSGIVQIGARTPANLAMAAMSLQSLSGGRFLLGLGTSGPQVMEGWHGVRLPSPLSATRETVEIVRRVAAGERLEHHGRIYDLPLAGGPGRAIRSMLPPTPVPIYIAALGPKNLALTGELADGWIGNAFIPERADAFLPFLEGGVKAGDGRTLADLDLLIPVAVEFTDDVDEAAARHARGYAFTIGAMGSKDSNFYNAAFARQGFADDVAAVQDLWLAGRREEAAERVPREIGLKTNLLGRRPWSRTASASTAGRASPRSRPSSTADLQHKVDTLAQLLDLVTDSTGGRMTTSAPTRTVRRLTIDVDAPFDEFRARYEEAVPAYDLAARLPQLPDWDAVYREVEQSPRTGSSGTAPSTPRRSSPSPATRPGPSST